MDRILSLLGYCGKVLSKRKLAPLESAESRLLPIEEAPLVPSEDQNDLLNFEPEESPERFFNRIASEPVPNSVAAPVTRLPRASTETDVDWEGDLSLIQIEGDAISSDAANTSEQGEHEQDEQGEHEQGEHEQGEHEQDEQGEHEQDEQGEHEQGEHEQREQREQREQGREDDFLKVRNRGRQSFKRAVVPSGTRFSIDADICLAWASEILEKRWFSSEDMDMLISCCEGNGDIDELRFNLLRILDVAGLVLLSKANESDDTLWDVRSDVSADELAEAIEVVFSRATRLPGTQRFVMSKSDEARVLATIAQTKQALQLGILACKPAVEDILSAIDKLLGGSVKPSFVTVRSIILSRPGDVETEDFFAAAQALRTWHSTGRVMNGRHRRQALEALETLSLSLLFYKAMIGRLAEHGPYLEAYFRLDAAISAFEMATERLILEHLPYARRVAARSVEDGEDLEDAFQVAFMGLERSIHRFDPERNHRFMIYASFWINQALMRWRADEGRIVRIPVHRHQELEHLDRAVEWLDARHAPSSTEARLAIELGWSKKKVQMLLRIPRHWSNLDWEKWEEIILDQDHKDAFDQAETAWIVSEALAELPERQANVIRMRFGIDQDDKMTLQEIGHIYGVTRERIRQIEAIGLARLSHPRRKRLMQTLLGI